MPETAPASTTDAPPFFDEQPTEEMPAVVVSPTDPPTEELPVQPVDPPEPLDEVTPPPTDAPVVDDGLDEQLKAKVIDISHGLGSQAVDQSDAYLARASTERGFKGIIKKIWYGNIARDYIRQRQIQRAKQEMVESGDVFIHEEGSRQEHNQATASVVNGFVDGYLHDGEREDALGDVEHGQELETNIHTLVSMFASGNIGIDTLEEEKTRILSEFGHKVRAEDRDKGLLYADNIVEVAQNARAAFRNGVALDRIDQALSTGHGEARMGARTEVRKEFTDRIVDKVYGTKYGGLLNETTIALAAGAAMTVAKLTTRKATTAVAATATLGLGAGIIAGTREHAHIGQERQLHLRQMATGQALPEHGAKRREQLEETRYETVAARELIDQLAQAREAVAAADATSLQDAVRVISEVEARIKHSDDQSIDLIAFSSNVALASERLQLDITLDETKEATSRALGNAGDSMLDDAGLGSDLTSELEGRVSAVRDLLSVDVNAKDAEFSRLRRRRTAKMAAVGFVSGVVIGEAIQEVRALVSDELQGVFESSNGQQDRRTLLAGILGHHAGGSLGAEHGGAAASGVHDVALGKNAKLGLPSGYNINETSPGHWELLGNGGTPVAHDLAVDGHGHLTESSQAALQHAGFHVHDQAQPYETSHLAHQKVTRSPEEFLHHHPGDFTHVNRELWYDNNTPNVFDKNELRLWWGGGNNTGMDDHGNYVFNVAQMTPDGSFHDGLSTDAQHLIHDGKMAIALSMTKDTQSHVVMIPIDGHGNAVIKADSWMAHSMFDMRDGQAHFTGAYAEAVQLMGKHNGVESMRMLATEVGEDRQQHITDTVSHLITHHHERIFTQLSHLPEPGNPNIPIEIPPVLPIYSRRGLENLEHETAPLEYIGYGYIRDGYRAGEGLLPRRGLAPFNLELEADPDAEIDADNTAQRYLRSLNPNSRRVVEKLVDSLDGQPKAEKPKIVVMIPAASHQEGKNIYTTLQQYAHQENVNPEDFEVVVFANYPAGQKPDQTTKEVKRFQKANPGLKVRLIEKKLEDNEAKIGWIRKTLTDTVITDLIDRGVSLNEVMLVSNDADSEWINPNYLRTIISKAEASPETDGFLGFIDWGHDAYKARPEMLTATRFMQMVETYLRVSKHEIGSSGANFAFRPGIYAAVGGYQANSPLAEDVLLGRMIKSVRAGANTRRPIAFLGRSSEVNTSARRALDKLFKDGGAPAAQWDDGFGVNDELRNREFGLEDFDFDDEAAVADMVLASERMINQTLNIYSGYIQSDSSQSSYRQGRLTMYNNETIRQVNRICFFLGIGVDWQPDGSIKITDAEKMITGLKSWQVKH